MNKAVFLISFWIRRYLIINQMIPKNANTTSCARVNSNQFFALVFYLILMCFFSCSSSKKITISGTSVISLAPQSNILIKEIQIGYEDIKTGEKLDPIDFKGDQVTKYLKHKITSLLISKGFEIIKDQSTQGLPGNKNYTLRLGIKVKVGPGGSWDPFTGAITSGMSYTRMSAKVYNSINEETIWKNKVQLRKIPTTNNKDFDKAINLLFQTLKTQS